jgi:uncharacterized protein (TIGR03435 family)
VILHVYLNRTPMGRMKIKRGVFLWWRDRLLCALGIAAVVPGGLRAVAQPPSEAPLAFSIVSIKPHGSAPGGKEGCNVDGCHFVDRPLRAFIMVAYNLSDKHIVGGKVSAYDDHFDLDAKIDPADMPATPLSSRQLGEMLQPVLADRFRLRVHHETRSLPVYEIVVAKGGVKMKESALSEGRCHSELRGNVRTFHFCTVNDLTNILEDPAGRYLVDRTGLTGRYDFELAWAPARMPADATPADVPSIFTSVQEQLGLKLEPSAAPLDVLVIDSAQRPSEN